MNVFFPLGKRRSEKIQTEIEIDLQIHLDDAIHNFLILFGAT